MNKSERIKSLQRMTLIQLGKKPLPKSILKDIGINSPIQYKRKPRTIIPAHKLEDVKDYLRDRYLEHKNYATIFAEFEYSNILESEYSVSFKVITLLLNEISKNVCRINSYEHKVYKIFEYEKTGINKTQIAKLVGMRREAVYIAYKKNKRKK